LLVIDVLAAEERKFRDLVSRSRTLLGRLYPSGRLTEEDYQFLRDTHGLPTELVTHLLSEPATTTPRSPRSPRRW
jgi:alanyl-tRNA synthetase